MMKSIVKRLKLRQRLCMGVFSLLIVSTVILPAFTFNTTRPVETRFVQHIEGFQPQTGIDDCSVSTKFISDDFLALPGFSSHLPLIVIDTRGQDIPIHRTWYHHEDGHSFMIPIPYIDPNIDSIIYFFDSGERNRLTDTPTIISYADVRRRGNTSMVFEKAQIRVRLKTETDENNNISILGMAPHHLWILRSSILDSTLIRDYLAMTVAAEFMPFVPNMRFVEVFFREDEGYRYQGVYILFDHIRQGPDRIAISGAAARGETSYIIRRDRYSLTRPILDTYATRNRLSYGFFDVVFPRNENLTDDFLRFIEQDISHIERILYSDDPQVFLTYTNYIDVSSFVDYFLINEFFMNFDAGFHSTYFYRDLGGLLHAGPVWDFDFAMDRYHRLPARLHGISFSNAPWFDRLVRHDEFAMRLIRRYRELRRNYLCPNRIDAMICEISEFLRPARQRDWKRWGHLYTSTELLWTKQDIDPNNIPYLPLTPFESVIGDFNRQLSSSGYDPIMLRRRNYTFEQEIILLRYVLRTHGDAMLRALVLYLHDEAEITNASNIFVNSFHATAFVLVFISSIIILKRTM